MSIFKPKEKIPTNEYSVSGTPVDIRAGDRILSFHGPSECELLRMKLLLWQCVFQKYESFKANGTTTVSVDDIINDYKFCDAATSEPKIVPLDERKDTK